MKKQKSKDTEYFGQHSLDELQNSFMSQFNYNFWIHKANMILHFIDNFDAITALRQQQDIYTPEVINENLKMELHMSIYHSSESLFRIIFSIVKMPEVPWIWIARCSATQLYELIKQLKDSGLASLSENPEVWLRQALYPTYSKEHEKFEQAEKSTEYVIKYLQRLAREYIEHKEYNSYKHGLHCFAGIQRIQAFGEQTGELYLDSQSDIVEFLEFSKDDPDGHRIKVNIARKSYDYKRDYRIIQLISAILHNLFNYRSIMASNKSLEIPALAPVHHVYYFFDDWWTLDELFSSDSDKTSKGASIKRFTD